MTSQVSKSRLRVAVLALGLVLASSATAAAALYYVYPAKIVRFATGKSYSTHAANWWQWALSAPADVNPILDETGEHCAEGQSGPIWYLAGSFSGEPVARTCKVPFGKTLVFPVANSAWFAFASDPEEEKTEAFIRSQVASADAYTDLEVTIDGVAVRNLGKFFETSDVFSVTLPEGNIFGLDEGFELSPSVDSGYYLAVAPLLLGEHTVHIHGEVDGFVVDVTYELTVSLR